MFYKNLKRLRKEHNLTQKELAEKLNVSDKTINHWKRKYSEPDIKAIMDLKDFFNISYDELFED